MPVVALQHVPVSLAPICLAALLPPSTLGVSYIVPLLLCIELMVPTVPLDKLVWFHIEMCDCCVLNTCLNRGVEHELSLIWGASKFHICPQNALNYKETLKNTIKV